MVLEGEAFIGKNVDDVVGEIIRIETELGYLVVGKDDNKVTVTVSAETDKISEKINTQIYGTIAKVCEELNLTAVIENVKGYVIDEIKALAKELDPTLTEEEINSFHLSTLKLSYEEAVKEYEYRANTRLGKLVANRELPVLYCAKEIIDLHI